MSKTAAKAGLVALLAAGVVLPGFSGNNAAFADSEPRSGFFSVFPARPNLKLPELGDIQIWKSDMKKARSAYRKGKYAKARKHLLKALKGGNFVAGWYLGHIYRLGLGVQANQEKAFHFYRGVALQYDDNEANPRVFMITLDSLVHVANSYRTGIKGGSVRKDPARAFRLYNSAARRGHPAAQFGLGLMFVNGEGVNRNPRRGLKWVNGAAQKNFAPALAYLGDLHWKGKYLKKNRRRAVALYMIAVRTGREDTHPHIYDRLDELLQQLPENQFNKAKRFADNWLQRHPARVRPAGEGPVPPPSQ